MTDKDLRRLFDLLVNGDIAPDEHEFLQQTLKSDANARAAFHERMDLEAGLRTWALEPAPATTAAQPENRTNDRPSSAMRWVYSLVALAAAVLLIAGVQAWNRFSDADPQHFAEGQANERLVHPPAATRLVGFIREQEGCRWSVRPVSTAGRFAVGKLELDKGVAEMSFDSGTDVTLEGPCEIEVTSIDTARLLAGNVCVNVGELSGGFTLETPESQIIDEGTEYAVSLDEESTEVHVFDGSVIWIPTSIKADVNNQAIEDRIEAGEAKSYLRSDPTKPKRIPFGQRQFVRQLEGRVQEQADGNLLAYDGFENLAGRVRRGRSGFGWSDGWQPSGRARGRVGEIVDCPDDVVFGLSRSQRRMMLLGQESDMRSSFEQPLILGTDECIYISVLVERQPSSSKEDSGLLQISLEPDLPGRGRRLHQLVSFGVTNEGFPFVNSGNVVSTTAVQIRVDQPYLFVLKASIGNGESRSSLRTYAASEAIDQSEPLIWTVLGEFSSSNYPATSIRLKTGESTGWRIDELRVGKTWRSATSIEAR
ncbi:FecR family protein [Neorhodopirellula lusitana]|uniref:FecR family protein n=1 Tax=Neorhodopirellula lusitana TaxID=445327 RepID=A0ABY1QUP9_9BACT|nr:FecR domain-containing protein [Neorhodopirellula lusitana]SMP79248.1 FecR family protein [Neorhodopirellula lusitana]